MNRWLLMCLLCFQLSACVRTQRVASRYIKTQLISAQNGGTLHVEATESAELAGFSLSIPPGALGEDTLVTLELGLDDVVATPDTAASAVAILGPAGVAFSASATVVFSYEPESDEQPNDVQVLQATDGEPTRYTAPTVIADAQVRQVKVSLSQLGTLQVIQRRCTLVEQCPTAACTAGRCRSNTCGNVSCAPGSVCCDASCGRCTSGGTACPPAPCAVNDCLPSDCGPVIGLPNCVCANGTLCSDPICARQLNGACGWERGTCP